LLTPFCFLYPGIPAGKISSLLNYHQLFIEFVAIVDSAGASPEIMGRNAKRVQAGPGFDANPLYFLHQ
jgi:hypothetical protein